MLHVHVVGAEAARQVLHGLAPDVVEQRRVAALQQALEEDPLAQAGLGDLDLVEAALVHGRLHHHGAAEDHVGTVGLDASHRAALRRGPLHEQLDQLAQRVAREHEALHVGPVGPMRF